MAAPRLRPDVIKATLAALKRTKGDRTAAARILGIAPGTMRSRCIIIRDLGHAVQPPPAFGAEAVADPYAAPLRNERGARKDAERRLAQAVKALEEERAATKRWREAKIPAPARPIVTAKRKEDLRRFIIPDSHGMYADPAALAACIADLKAVDADEVVMLGDHVDCAGFLAAHHLPWSSNQLAYSYEQDLAACAQFLDQIQAAAPRARIHYHEGNHEAHVEWWANRQALVTADDADAIRRRNAPEFLLRLKERGVTYYRRAVDYGMGVPGANRLGNVVFVHDPGKKRAPQDMAKDWGLSMVHGHTHTAIGGVGRVAASGDLGAWCPGTLARRQPLYCHTNMTQWTHGVAVQIVAASGRFMHLQVPILDGRSLLPLLLAG